MESFYKAYWIALVVSVATLFLGLTMLTAIKADGHFISVLFIVAAMGFFCVYLAVINLFLFFSLVVLFFLIAQKWRGFGLFSALLLGLMVAWLNNVSLLIFRDHLDLPISSSVGLFFGSVLFLLYRRFEKSENIVLKPVDFKLNPSGIKAEMSLNAPSIDKSPCYDNANAPIMNSVHDDGLAKSMAMSNFFKAYCITLIAFAVFIFLAATGYIFAYNINYDGYRSLVVMWAAAAIFMQLGFHFILLFIIGLPFFAIVTKFTQFSRLFSVFIGVLAALANYGLLTLLSPADFIDRWGWFCATGIIFGLMLGVVKNYFDREVISS